MHTRLFGVSLTYVLIFTAFMNFAGLATFPPESFTIEINFSDLVFWLPNIQTSIEFSWSNIMTVLLVLSLTVIVILAVVSLVAQSLNMKYVFQVILGTSLSVGVATTMLATVGDMLPSWLHIFFIYLPCGLLIYSVLAIGE